MGHNLHSTIQYHQYQICVKAKLWCIFELLSLDRLGSMHLRNLLTLLETGRRPPNDKISGLTTIYHSRNLDPSLPILQLSGKTHKTLQDISVLEIVCEAEVPCVILSHFDIFDILDILRKQGFMHFTPWLIHRRSLLFWIFWSVCRS